MVFLCYIQNKSLAEKWTRKKSGPTLIPNVVPIIEATELKTRNSMLNTCLQAAQGIQNSLEMKVTLLEQNFESHENDAKYCYSTFTFATLLTSHQFVWFLYIEKEWTPWKLK